MDPVQLRTSLGLAEDATDEQVLDALLGAAQYAAAERDALATQLAKPKPPTTATPDLPAGVTVIDESTLEELKVAAAAGQQANATLRRQARDGFLGDAIKAGKFAPARKAHFEALFDADEEGTRQLVDKLAAGTVPVSEIGHAGAGADTDDDAFFARIAPSLAVVKEA